MFSLGATEIILILVVVVMFFGVGKLGDLGGALGRGIREFRKNASLDKPGQDGNTTKA
ncbi:MAG: twin-arginine translocase TatA/TatE family subunit [Chloroflexota bacterium]